jgi:hypothetical protein
MCVVTVGLLKEPSGACSIRQAPDPYPRKSLLQT